MIQRNENKGTFVSDEDDDDDPKCKKQICKVEARKEHSSIN
jgi:hypothetical protein